MFLLRNGKAISVNKKAKEIGWVRSREAILEAMDLLLVTHETRLCFSEQRELLGPGPLLRKLSLEILYPREWPR